MSQSEVERFTRAFKSDAALAAEVAKDRSLAAVVAVAARHGYRFTADEVLAYAKSLSDAELDALSGTGVWGPDGPPMREWEPDRSGG
ncbi:MAG: Nif11-like leader peptide family natural product precursor [Reyranella sp.]|nr:MAG: Nif11-like leader peptide family natural product precursor [Reyranella sp.]